MQSSCARCGLRLAAAAHHTNYDENTPFTTEFGMSNVKGMLGKAATGIKKTQDLVDKTVKKTQNLFDNTFNKLSPATRDAVFAAFEQARADHEDSREAARAGIDKLGAAADVAVWNEAFRQLKKYQLLYGRVNSMFNNEMKKRLRDMRNGAATYEKSHKSPDSKVTFLNSMRRALNFQKAVYDFTRNRFPRDKSSLHDELDHMQDIIVQYVVYVLLSVGMSMNDLDGL